MKPSKPTQSNDGYAKSPSTPTSTDTKIDKEIDDILEEYGYAIVNHPEASRASHIRPYKQALKTLLTSEKNKAVEAKDNAYWERNQLVSALTRLYPSWLGRHDGKDWEDDWRTIIYIDSPSGQLSWHIHDNDKKYFTHLDPGIGEWDGHTTEEKYDRLAQLNSLQGE